MKNLNSLKNVDKYSTSSPFFLSSSIINFCNYDVDIYGSDEILKRDSQRTNAVSCYNT